MSSLSCRVLCHAGRRERNYARMSNHCRANTLLISNLENVLVNVNECVCVLFNNNNINRYICVYIYIYINVSFALYEKYVITYSNCRLIVIVCGLLFTVCDLI